MTAARPKLTEPSHALRWVHAPQQARTREGLARLLEAAEELIAEKGFEEASIVEIARRAGTSVGGFYRRFRDKGGLIQALHQRFCEDAVATADAALAPARWQGASLAVVVREFVAFLVEIHRERAGLLRAFLRYAERDPEMRARSIDLVRALAVRLGTLLSSRRDEISHPDPDLAAAFGLEMVFGSLDQIVQLRPHAVSITDDRLVDEVSRAFGAYLGVGSRHLRPARKKEGVQP